MTDIRDFALWCGEDDMKTESVDEIFYRKEIRYLCVESNFDSAIDTLSYAEEAELVSRNFVSEMINNIIEIVNKIPNKQAVKS